MSNGVSSSGAPRDSGAALLLIRAYAAVLVLFGLAFVVGGGALVAAGGSVFYLAAGVALVAAGGLVWRRDPRVAWLYGGLVAVTIAWAVYEAGRSFWGLVPRLDVILGLGLPLLFRRVRAGTPREHGRGSDGWSIAGSALVSALALGVALHAFVMPHRVDPLLRDRPLAAAPERLPQPLAAADGEDWPSYGKDAGATRFSPVADLTAETVGKLRLAWSADTAPGFPAKSSPGLEVTPIVIGDTLYICNAYDAVVALDADTGRTKWTYRMSPRGRGIPCRGVAHAHVADGPAPCADRIIAASQEGDLVALDAASGQPCAGFGRGGRVSLLAGLSGKPNVFYYVNSAPQIIRGKAVVGGAVKDDEFYGEPSGVIRAYDVVTGKLAWAFDSGHTTHEEPPPGQSYRASSPNSWAPISADEALGLVYMPMGGSIPNFFNGYRKPDENNVATSVVALDAETGEMRWRFQTVHQDLWDYDMSAQATLVDLPTPTGIRKALIQPTKSGEIFVLDRVTGQPIMPVAEKPVPTGPTAPGNRVSPTQPFSTAMPSFHATPFREADMWGLTSLDQMLCRIAFKRSLYQGVFTPPALDRWSINEPGSAGGMEWGGASIDLDRGIAIINSVMTPFRVKLIKQSDPIAQKMKLYDGKGSGISANPMRNTPYAAEARPFVSPLGVPCNAPPWGRLTGVNIRTGDVVWTQPFGTGRDSGPLGIRSHLPFRMGVPNIGGSVAVRGGLVFIGAAADGYLRAFETTTGRQVWEARLPGAGTATPVVYRSRRSGRVFVVIAAGGKPGLETRVSNQLVAYALAGGQAEASSIPGKAIL